MSVYIKSAKRIQILSHDGIAKFYCAGLLVLTVMSFFPVLFHVQEYIFFGLLVASLVTAWKQKRLMLVPTPLDRPLLFFIGWVLLTVPFAVDPLYSFTEWRKLVAQGLLFYWTIFALRLFGHPHMVRYISLAVAGGTAVIALNAVIGFVQLGGLLFDRLLGVRALAMGSDSNVLSTYMVMAAPIVATIGVMPSMKSWRACSGAIFAVALLADYFSYMRAGWLAVAIEGISCGLITRKRWVIWVASGVSVGCFATIATLYQFGYYTGILNLESVYTRLQYWERGFAHLLASPLVGIGYGQLTMELSLHNVFAMVAVGSGLPAIILLVYLLICSVRSLVLQARTSMNEDQRVFAIGAAVMVVGFAVRNLFDSMFAGSLASLFWILLAVGLANCADGDGDRDRKYR
ncbi:MAG: hypothetical protein ITD36_05050 [Nitrospira sp.]|nr:hypothetical protein [Nitrospira sp.]